MASESVLAKMAVVISANISGFSKDLKGASSDVKSFTGGLKKIAGAAAAAFSIKEVAGFALELSKLAGQAEGVNNAFNKLPNSAIVLEDLKEATANTVSELELMKRAVEASNFGISLESLPKLLEFAAARAQQTGKSVDYLVDSIVTGIGRKSPLVLDNLGISAADLRKELDGVSISAASVGQVSEAVGRIASKNLKEQGGLTKNVSTGLQELNAEWENFKVAIGAAANGTGILGSALRRLISLLKESKKLLINKEEEQSIKKLAIIRDSVNEKLDEYNNADLKGKQDIRDELDKQLKYYELLAKASGEFQKGLDNADVLDNKTIKNLEKVTQFNFGVDAEDINKTGELTKRLKEVALTATRSSEAVNIIKKAIDNLGKNNDPIIGLVEALKNRIKELEEGIDRATSVSELRLFQKELENTKLELERLLDPLRKEIDIGDTLTDKLSERFKLFDTTEFKISPNITIDQDRLAAAGETLQNNLDGFRFRIQQTAEEVSVSLNDLASNAASSFAEVIGASLSDPDQDFGKNILKAAGEFAKKFGEILISAGFAAKAAQKLILRPEAAIAAGFALVAIGSAVSASLSKQASSTFGGSSGASSAGRASSFKPETGSSQDSKPETTFVLKGQDLWVTLKNYESGQKFTSSISG